MDRGHTKAAPPFKDVKMDGAHTEAVPPSKDWTTKNTGASLRITSESRGCINIYINNNIQGVNHSLLFGSHVKLRDPGIRISINGLTFQTQQPPNQTKNKKMKNKKKMKKLMRKGSLWSSMVLVSAAAVIASFFSFSLFISYL